MAKAPLTLASTATKPLKRGRCARRIHAIFTKGKVYEGRRGSGLAPAILGARPLMTSPKISVVMPVMNEERYIRTSIDSILAQTFTDFEFIIIDDGSTDSTPDILADYAQQDARIRVIRNKGNQGISQSLNHGIKASRGVYIARMDGDDINTPDRFEKQVALLDNNPNIVVAGAGYQTITADGTPQHAVIEGVEYWECDWFSIFRSTILHSIMMYRRDVVIKNNIFYDPDFEFAEDVEFAHRLLQYGTALCLPEVMLIRRFHPVNTTSRNLHHQRDAARRAAVINAQRRFPEISKGEIELLFSYLKPPINEVAPRCGDAVRIMTKIEHIFKDQHRLTDQQIGKMRDYSARWLAAGALNGRGAKKAFGAIRLAAAGVAYLPNLTIESVGWAQRRLKARVQRSAGAAQPSEIAS